MTVTLAIAGAVLLSAGCGVLTGRAIERMERAAIEFDLRSATRAAREVACSALTAAEKVTLDRAVRTQSVYDHGVSLYFAQAREMLEAALAGDAERAEDLALANDRLGEHLTTSLARAGAEARTRAGMAPWN